MHGYIYIAYNPSLKDQRLKIGKTKEITGRHRSLSNSSLPEAYEILFCEPCIYAHKAENVIFSRLKNYRTKKNREFFVVDYNLAAGVCLEVINLVNQNPLKSIEELILYDLSDESLFWIESPWG